jgi:hypothetical protein
MRLNLAAQQSVSQVKFRTVCVHHDVNTHMLLDLKHELGCRVVWEEVTQGGKLRTVFTGDLLQAQLSDAKFQSSEIYVVRGTYLANTGVIGAVAASWKV